TIPRTDTVPSTPDASAAIAQSRSGGEGAPHLPAEGRGREGEHYTLGYALTRAAHVRAYERKPGEPLYRPLHIFALDPSASRRDGAVTVVDVPYEPLEPGPAGSLFRVMPADGEEPVDLEDRMVLIGQGRAASATDPKFRAQMAYAVCSTTYAAFRHALGRDLAWGFDRRDAGGRAPRLRIRTDVPELENAYYDRPSGELRFGTFRADKEAKGRNQPNGIVHTVLSQDVIVHECSHALLDGMRTHFMIPTNPDVLAFHEAFADVIAVLQRFTYKDVVRAGIRAARGEVRFAELLTTMALQFGQTIGMTGGLRSAVGGTDLRYGTATEPHELGKVLLAAVFEAFATIYSRKTEPLVRLASGGTGVLPEGAIPDLLAELLTEKACSLASQFLSVCIRAVDYCPPVDITFGEYLRAVITADYDLVPDDPLGYREAWIDAFRKYGVYPSDVPSLTEDALLWRASDVKLPAAKELGFDKLQFDGDPARPAGPDEIMRQGRALGALACDPTYAGAFGLALPDDPRLEGDPVDLPVVQSIRSARRAGPDGQIVFDLVAEVTQRREVRPGHGLPGLDVYGGTTIILDPTGTVRYLIGKSVLKPERVQRQREYASATSAFWGDGPFGKRYPEPKALRTLHGEK
ncbi:MAG TPA: hypothetical protein VF461_20850, partial [Gemmatimonadaceae bacterium]